jgi:hypothetical protein
MRQRPARALFHSPSDRFRFWRAIPSLGAVQSMILKSMPVDLIRGWIPVLEKVTLE